MHQQRLHNREAHRQARIERGVGILKDKLDIAPQMRQRRAGEPVDALAVKGNGAALARHQPQQRTPGGGFAAARFAYQRQRLAGVEIETHLLYRVHATLHAVKQAAANIEARHQIAHLQNRVEIATRGVLRRLRLRLAAGVQQRKTRGQRLTAHRAELRHRRQQRLGIGLLRRVEQLLHRRALHHVATVHHLDAVRHFGHHAHIVGDKNHPHLHLFLQHADQLQDLRLNSDVERRGRLIGDQQRGTARQRHGDHHALAHAAGELMR